MHNILDLKKQQFSSQTGSSRELFRFWTFLPRNPSHKKFPGLIILFLLSHIMPRLDDGGATRNPTWLRAHSLLRIWSYAGMELTA